ncbi:MAG: methyl-accepting chemotaxis protein [Candidatus Omnitrophica bacterium]|nr:methyl-accepting chemotaxis protein [Candidatus Omnitrophota bacterium]
MRRNSRKNYLIDKTFQTQFIFKFCLLIIVASLVTGVLIYYFNRQTTTVAFENLRVVVKSTSDFILPIIIQILLIVTVFAGIVTILVTLFTTHKISGPLYRLKNELERIRSGDLTRTVRIRSADQLQIVASELDSVRKNIKESLQVLKAQCDLIKDYAQKSREGKEDAEGRKRLSECATKIESEISKFRID